MPCKEMIKMPKKKKEEITIRSSAAEYLTYIASVGDNPDSMEIRYEDENIWLTQKMLASFMMLRLTQLTTLLKRFLATQSCKRIQLFENFE